MSDKPFSSWKDLESALSTQFDRIASAKSECSRQEAAGELWNVVDSFDDDLPEFDIDGEDRLESRLDADDRLVGTVDIPDSLASVDPPRTAKLSRLLDLVAIGRVTDVIDVADYLAASASGVDDQEDEERSLVADTLGSILSTAVEEFNEDIDNARQERTSENNPAPSSEGVDREGDDGELESGIGSRRASRRPSSFSTVPASRTDMGSAGHNSIPQRRSSTTGRRDQSDSPEVATDDNERNGAGHREP